jgi:hypothetical protein
MVASLCALGYQTLRLSQQVQTLERLKEVASARIRRQDRETREKFQRLSEVLAAVQPAVVAAPSPKNHELQIFLA